MRLLELDLDVYQGPFDLLFTLILKEEVDVCEVPLVEVILAYVEDLAGTSQADWESLTEFLVLITSLLELKSRLLLPRNVLELEEIDPDTARDLLLQRLLTYRMHKGVAAHLHERLVDQRGRLARPASRPRRRPRPPLEKVAGTMDPTSLREAISRLLEARREPDSSHVTVSRVDLPRQIARIRHLLNERGRLSFEEVFGAEDPMIQAVSLFAVLELYSHGLIHCVQRQAFGDIVLRLKEVRKIA
ncbi:MAG: segregation/condensation protein A [Thermoleophilia bacterium]|nr:segregation/condensation protein A [Thermoleophilia bacterium]